MGFFDSVWSGIKSVGKSIGDGVSSIGKKAWDGIKTGGQWVWNNKDKILDGIQKGADIAGKVASVVPGLQKFSPIIQGIGKGAGTVKDVLDKIG